MTTPTNACWLAWRKARGVVKLNIEYFVRWKNGHYWRRNGPFRTLEEAQKNSKDFHDPKTSIVKVTTERIPIKRKARGL